MARQYSIAEARDRFPAIVRDAEKGAPIQITRHGRPVAVIVSVTRYERLKSRRPDFWATLQRFRASHDLRALDIDSVFANVRDRSGGREVRW
ncbi:MAG: type II toxin-antitoxin system Phd/YefM family antitoxin [Planctomycetota bacterium]